ncbi:hypothetical protein ACHHYP_20180 [Achlya hypogyna]|uniref:Secreted protein n=1 Tax=Achlya hypogyna TaxID=1202772 RepID=A0A1V9Z1B2_ACHHY|nr:hypothetical protein ACHHYP_20180 [Achlya hypogyna]
MRVSLLALVSAVAASGANHQCVNVYQGARYCFDADGVVCDADEGACPTAGTKASSRCLDFLESYNGDNCVLPRDTVCQQVKNKWRCVLPKAANSGPSHVSAPGPVDVPTTRMAQPRRSGLGKPQHHKPTFDSDSGSDGIEPDADSDDIEPDADSDDIEPDAGSDDFDSDAGSEPEEGSHMVGDSANTNPKDTGSRDNMMAGTLGNPVHRSPTNYTLGDAATAAPTTETVHSVSNAAADGANGASSEAPSQGMVAVYAVGGIACVAAALFVARKRRASAKAKADDECLVTPAVPHPDIVPKEGSSTPTLMASTEKIKVTNV